MKKIHYLFIFLLLVPFLSSAQRWRKERFSLVVGIGTNHFMGDLGGGKKDAAHFLGIRDLDMSSTRPTFQVALKYKILQELAVKPIFSYARLYGSDAASGSLGRRSRNLHFMSNIWELGVQVEYSFIKEKGIARYTFSSIKASKRISAYVLFGGGMFLYNPKAKDASGSWVSLRELRTEGQGQASYTYTPVDDSGALLPVETITPDKSYGRIAAYFSAGLGIRYSLNRRFGIGLEITTRYTTTDYIDDSHDRYYNYGQLGTTAPSDQSDYFADRHLEVDWSSESISNTLGTTYTAGKPFRGNPSYNDAYIFTVITGYYKLQNTMKSLPKFP